jgi:hypothetical protein
MSAIWPIVTALLAHVAEFLIDGQLFLAADAEGLVELAAAWRMSAISPS